MLRTKIKASSITHLTDARYFAAWEVEWLGFQLSPGSEHTVDPRLVSTLREWVDGVKICGEFNLATGPDILAAIDLLALETVEVGMFTPRETLVQLQGKAEIIQEVVVEAYADTSNLEELMLEHQDLVAYFLLHFGKGGITWADLQAGIPLPVEQLADWARRFPLLIDLPLGDTLPQDFLAQVPARGLNVQGGEEEKVGLKNFDQLDAFLEDLELLV
ncbi:MAG: hypothetical protein DA408_08890 [Bacteroidetes bacterium]|nr:MAG: hypothetical protein C7N36_07495 [Bacteroidota bacterium]PTM12834.1 MAG: hypothetical protein DA408_08890 [Bacteroidota bacterium]